MSESTKNTGKNLQSAPREPMVVVDNVTKTYTVRTGRKFWAPQHVEALQETTLVAYAGESVGILGQNGSGKSTLMRLIAGTERPTSGTVLVRKQPTLLGVNAALIQEVDGIKNARLGCLAMGLTPEETEAALGEIIEMADIGDAIHRPMNTYSSGQAARLRFSIGTIGNPEILLIDEALSTGDAGFNQKAEKRMNELVARSGVVFLVSHAPRIMAKMVDRAIWIHEGFTVADGPSQQVCYDYVEWADLKSAGNDQEADDLLRAMRLTYVRPNLRLS